MGVDVGVRVGVDVGVNVGVGVGVGVGGSCSAKPKYSAGNCWHRPLIVIWRGFCVVDVHPFGGFTNRL